jgi:hypothetical protein
MNVKTALDFYKQVERNIEADKKVFGKAMVSPEEIALRTMVSAYLKQRLVIKQLQNQNNQLKKGNEKWNNLLKML